MRFSISRKECLISCLRTSVLNIIEHTSTVLRMKMHSAVIIICMPSMTGRVHNIQFKCVISWREFLRGTKRLEIYSSSYCISVYILFIHTFFCLASHSGIQILWNSCPLWWYGGQILLVLISFASFKKKSRCLWRWTYFPHAVKETSTGPLAKWLSWASAL